MKKIIYTFGIFCLVNMMFVSMADAKSSEIKEKKT